MAGLLSGKHFLGVLYLAIFASTCYLFRRRLADGFGKNECDMTFMWRRIMLLDVGFAEYNQYSLALYGEGNYAHYFMNTNQVDGIPIIFVPGNAGSVRQVRSLASVLQNKTESRNTPFHFDVFAVSFNEEFSGINSNYLVRHTEFVQKAVKHVWNMYRTPPSKIILFGHSLGGIISRLALDDDDVRDKISMVFALASPFGEPPLPVSIETILIWNVTRSIQTDIPTISIDGGLRDELIDPAWTRASFVLHASSTEIDDVWLESDHQCIVWCNQLVRQTTRFLFDYARAPKKFAENHVRLFNKHFKNSLQYVKTTKPLNSSSFVSPEDCAPKCPTDGILRLDSTFQPNHTLVSLSPRFSSQLTANKQVIGEVHLCSSRTICSFFSGPLPKDDALVVIGLKGKEAWIIREDVDEQVVLPAMMFAGGQPLQLQFKLVRFKILSLRFNSFLFVYRVQINSTGPIEPVIFVTNSTKRLARVDGLHQFLFIVSEKDEGNAANLYLFGGKDAQVTVSFQVDFSNTIVRILREVRQYVIPLMIFIHFVCSIGNSVKINRWLVPATIILLPLFVEVDLMNLILVAATSIVSILLYIFILAANTLISPVFKWLSRRLYLIGVVAQRLVLVSMIIGSSYMHRFPFVVAASLWLISANPDSSNLLILTEMFLLTQFPSGFEFVFGVVKYRQFVYRQDFFGVSAMMFIANSGLITIMKTPIFGFITIIVFFIIYAGIEFGVSIHVLYNIPIESFIALDALSYVCALLMTYELFVVLQNNYNSPSKTE